MPVTTSTSSRPSRGLLPELTGPDQAEVHATHQMTRVVAFAEILGAQLSTLEEPGDQLEQYREAVHHLATLGIGRGLDRMPAALSASNIDDLSTAVLNATEDSPVPDAEWDPLTRILGEELPALLGVSSSSVARYHSGDRRTPDSVAARLHGLTLIVSDLSGSYNDYGIRRWFKRPRRALEGRAPADILHGDWDPDGIDVRAVRNLAAELLGASVQ